jgi:hypothetical protein
MTSEADLQVQVADYLRLQYPDVMFHSDYGSGIKLTMGQAIKQKRQNGGRRAWPDMFIAEPIVRESETGQFYKGYYYPTKQVYNGLFLELKRPGTRIFKKDGTLVANEHIREQFDILEQLRKRGYMAEFACGFDEAKRIIDGYLGK